MLLGRDEIIDSLASQSVRRQLVTIVGSAGVGKSFLASAIAGRTASRYANGTVFVDQCRRRAAAGAVPGGGVGNPACLWTPGK